MSERSFKNYEFDSSTYKKWPDDLKNEREKAAYERGFAAAQARHPINSPELFSLPRYGIEWQGERQPICKSMSDGYWTPWHIAADAIQAAFARGLVDAWTWLPMETAPKDGTPVYLKDDAFDGPDRVYLGHYYQSLHDADCFYWTHKATVCLKKGEITGGMSINRKIFNPTHWMPLPSPNSQPWVLEILRDVGEVVKRMDYALEGVCYALEADLERGDLDAIGEFEAAILRLKDSYSRTPQEARNAAQGVES